MGAMGIHLGEGWGHEKERKQGKCCFKLKHFVEM